MTLCIAQNYIAFTSRQKTKSQTYLLATSSEILRIHQILLPHLDTKDLHWSYQGNKFFRHTGHSIRIHRVWFYYTILYYRHDFTLTWFLWVELELNFLFIVWIYFGPILLDCNRLWRIEDVFDNVSVSIYNGLSSIVSISKELNLPFLYAISNPFWRCETFLFLMLVVVLVLVRSWSPLLLFVVLLVIVSISLRSREGERERERERDQYLITMHDGRLSSTIS